MQSKVSSYFLQCQFDVLLVFFRIREQPTFVQSLRNLPTYSEIPLSIREYLEYGSKTTMPQSFDPLRTLTPTAILPPPSTASPQPPISHSPSLFTRMNSGPPISNQQQQYPTGNGNGGGGGVGRENASQRGVSPNISEDSLQDIFHLAIINPKC